MEPVTENSSSSLLGEGDRRAATVEGLGQYPASPSTSLSLVPLPQRSGEGFREKN